MAGAKFGHLFGCATSVFAARVSNQASARVRCRSALGERRLFGVVQGSRLITRRVFEDGPSEHEISSAEHEASYRCGSRLASAQPHRDAEEHQSPKHRRQGKNDFRHFVAARLRRVPHHGKNLCLIAFGWQAGLHSARRCSNSGTPHRSLVDRRRIGASIDGAWHHVFRHEVQKLTDHLSRPHKESIRKCSEAQKCVPGLTS